VASEMTLLRTADAISTFCQFTLRSECRLIVSNGRMRGSDFGFYAVALSQVAAVFHDLHIEL
jgi:hypothetical protein